MKITAGTNSFPTPHLDSTPAADPYVQQLVAENARLKTERDQLATINARLQQKLDTLRNGVAILSDRIKEDR